MSVTIDYSQLPLGQTAVTSLHKSYPDVQINYNTAEELCTLRGPYSQVQAAIAQLLGLPGGPGSRGHTDTSHPAASGSAAVPVVRSAHTHQSGDHGRRHSEKRGHTEQDHIGRSSGEQSSSPHEDLTSGGHGWEDTGQTEDGAVAMQMPRDPTMVEEDFSLIMDADLFQYLQKHCGKEYQRILSQHGVEVVDMTTEGVTTLFLQSVTGAGEVDHKLERLRLASGELSWLYQENEAKIRRAQLPKSILSPSGGLQRAMENLGVRLPKLLLSEDDRNVYIIGSSCDVSEAKQFLLLDHGKAGDVVDDVASLLRSPSFGCGPSKSAEEERLTPTLSSRAGSLDRKIDKMLRLDEDERRTEGARRYKLAARFKDSGLGGLGNRPGDLASAGLSSPSTQTGLGPMLGHDVLLGSGRAGLTGGGLSRAGKQNTGGDILFKSGDPLFSSTSMQSTPSLSSTSVSTGQKFTTAPFSTTTLSGGTTLPPTGSGTNLRRASSFSGMFRPKAQLIGQSEDQKDSGKATTKVRGRSSSFSNRTGRDKREVLSAEITVNIVMWQYIKEAYAAHLEDLTTDLQMKESYSEASRDVTVILRGIDSSRVNSCQVDTQKLVAMVATDFCLQELRLSELGVVDPADETLEVCCAEVRSRFKKVSIQILKESVFLCGPKQLCSQVGTALREVFSGASRQMLGQEDLSIPSTSTFNKPISLQGNRDQNTYLYHKDDPQQKLDNQRGGDDGTGGGQESKSIQSGDSTKRQRNTDAELSNGAASQSVARKNPVMKEKVGRGGIMEVNGNKADTFISHTAKVNERSVRPVNGIGSTSAHTSQDMATFPKESNLHSKVKERDNEQQGGSRNQQNPGGSFTRRGLGRSSLRGPGLGGICVCGKSGDSVKRTECGVTLCSECLVEVHVHCRVCPKMTRLAQGIQGNMSYAELPFSLQGHTRDSTVKIVYYIPDGIQGVREGLTFIFLTVGLY